MSTEPESAAARRLAETLDRLAERSGVDDVAPRAQDDQQTAAVLDQLRAPSTWTGPPPELRSQILAAASAEQAAEQSPAAQPVAEPVAKGRPGQVRQLVPRWRRLAVAVPVAAVAAVAFTFAVLAVDDYVNRPEPGTTYAASGTPLAPRAEADISVAPSAAGFSVVLDARDLPAAAPGSYYAAFLSGPRGVVPLGSFHARKVGKPITMWSGVDPRTTRTSR